MKKVLLALLAVGLIGSAVAATVTNELGQIIVTTAGVNGLTTVITPKALSVSAEKQVIIAPIGSQLSEVNPVVSTAYTPRGLGDQIIGTVAGSVYVATGVGSGNWQRVAVPASTSTGTTIGTNSLVPRYIGDIHINTVSNWTYIAKGLTSNDWISISP